MDKRNVRKFKSQQERLAKEIANAHRSVDFTVNYEQKIPSVYTDRETGNLVVRDNRHYIFPTPVICKGKHRLIVTMRFRGGIYNRRIVDKILRRNYSMKYTEDGFEIKLSFNPHKIAKI